MNVHGRILTAASIASAACVLGLATTPAHASSGDWYAASICGSGYSPDGSDALVGSVVYVSYNGSTDCVVTVKTANVGTPTLTMAGIYGANPSWGGNMDNGATDQGYFKYYAGPVYNYSPGMCIQWGGGTNLGTGLWEGHCG